jgi:hypothetical protein
MTWKRGCYPTLGPRQKIPHFLLYFWKIRRYKGHDMAEYCKAIYVGPYGPGIPIIFGIFDYSSVSRWR